MICFLHAVVQGAYPFSLGTSEESQAPGLKTFYLSLSGQKAVLMGLAKHSSSRPLGACLALPLSLILESLWRRRYPERTHPGTLSQALTGDLRGSFLSYNPSSLMWWLPRLSLPAADGCAVKALGIRTSLPTVLRGSIYHCPVAFTVRISDSPESQVYPIPIIYSNLKVPEKSLMDVTMYSVPPKGELSPSDNVKTCLVVGDISSLPLGFLSS